MTLPSPNRRVSIVTVLAVCVACAAGCQPREDGLSNEAAELLDDVTEAETLSSSASAITFMPLLALTESNTVSLAQAVAAQEATESLFSPDGCLAVTTNGNQVTYAFDGCKSPVEALSVSGIERSTFAPGSGPGTLHMEMESDGLELSGRGIEHVASVDVAVTDTSSSVSWSGSYSGKTPKDVDFDYESSLSFSFDGGVCVSLVGTSSGRVGLRGLDAEYDITRCGPLGTCPVGRLEATRPLLNTHISVAFDGTTKAIVTGVFGTEHEVDIACTPP